ncbi:MAG: nucleoside hydrolase [Verrucomicrobia bacterium]|nr:nucleoside hydrolase [Verrucomicrobiota bacterium]
MRPLILDTDIGTDVDDILALILVAKAKELELIGVTTVYGDTQRRAKIARAILNRLGLPDLPVIAGLSRPLSGRQVYWAGIEGEGIADLELIDISSAQAADDFLIEAARNYPGQLEILAIGPLTNLASAIAKSPDFVKQVKSVFLMGGAYWMENYVEHNILCDVDAAADVFKSDLPITAVGLDLTLRVWLEESGLAEIRQGDPQIGDLIENQVRNWWRFRRITKNNPHDPLAALAMVEPDLFRFEMWDVGVSFTSLPAGLTVSSNAGKGRIRLASDILMRSAEQAIVRRLAG